MGSVRMRLLLPLVLVGAGCSGSPSQSFRAKADLGAIAMEYHWYVDVHRKPPANMQELVSFKNPYTSLSGNQSSSSRATAALQSGDYVVLWSYNVAKDLAQNGNYILAYHKGVPTEGGYVAFADSSTRKLSRAQFAATPKAPSTANADGASTVSENSSPDPQL